MLIADVWNTMGLNAVLRLLGDELGVATVVQDELANTYQRIDRTD